MAQRLVETYRIGDSVEVFFQDEVAEEWRPARVVALQHPGLWVITEDRRALVRHQRQTDSPQFPSPFSSRRRERAG